MADSALMWYSRPELNKFGQDVYDPYEYCKCLELENNLQHALSELNSLEIINIHLFKELGETTAKFEVISGLAV
jgi:hypothetical protein